MISSQLEQTSTVADYSQDGTIFLYENTPVTLQLVGINIEKVSKVRRSKNLRTRPKCPIIVKDFFAGLMYIHFTH